MFRPSLTPGNAEEVFVFEASNARFERNYDISRDGERFLKVKEDAGGRHGGVRCLINWFQELKRLIPTDN